jgi:hypothetical protein
LFLPGHRPSDDPPTRTKTTQGEQIPEPFNAGVVLATPARRAEELHMHGIIYLVGLIVVIMAILSFFGLR